MPESEGMKPETNFRSPLDKPLGELTEEDISQLTREDCRRYLKEKGMRRPSWNKSQAIQQVISLKNLLEARPDSGDVDTPIHPKPPSPAPDNPPHIDTVTVEESAMDRKKDVAGDGCCQIPATGIGSFPVENNISPRGGCERAVRSGPSAGQMTIFYDGKVNVYEAVPIDKARMIMQLAGSPNSLVYETMVSSGPAVRTMSCRAPPSENAASPPMPVVVSSTTQTPSGKPAQYTQESIEELKITRESEAPTNRKACLQRYLEKRKDRGRFKNKKKIGSSSSSSLEMYINQQVRTQTSNGQSSRSGTCSPTQPKPPHTPTRCSSMENLPKNLNICVDLNDEGPEDEC